MNSTYLMPRAGMIAAALAIAVPGTASADSYDLGTIGFGETRGHVFSHTPGTFTDTLTFAIGVPGPGSASYHNFLVTAGRVRSNISNATFTLTGPSGFAPFSSALSNGGSYPLQLLSGTYTATIAGRATGVNGGAYNIDITAPTPEPATMGLMIGGAAAAGWVARRRRRAATRQPG